MAGNNQVSAQVQTENLSQDDVIERLKYAFAYDHLDVVEFESRLEKAAATTNSAELKALVIDLPGAGSKPEPKVELNRTTVKSNGLILSLMSGVTRKGKWKPPKRLTAISVMGGMELDFTKAQLPPGVTEVNVFSVMGGVDIIVPPGVNVDASGFAIMGGYDDNTVPEVEHPDAPTLKVRGLAVMGGVEVRPPKQDILKKILKKIGIID